MSKSTEKYIRFCKNLRSHLNHEDFMNFDDNELESNHTFIQIVFPTDISSKYNPNAPVISVQDFKNYIVQDEEIISKLKMSVEKILNFWGLNISNEEIYLVSRKRCKKLNYSNHNTLRFSRMLRSLVLHGLSELSHKILNFVESLDFLCPSTKNGKTMWRINYEESLRKMEI